MVEFTVDGEVRKGRVTKVGKPNGKDKHRCWIKNTNNYEESFDFIKDIDSWSILEKKVQFPRDLSSYSKKKEKIKEDDTLGIFYLRNHRIDDNDINDTFVTLIPKNHHNDREVVNAKKDELSKWKLYDAFEEIEENEDHHVISSKWVITEKDGGKDRGRKIKARLCV